MPSSSGKGTGVPVHEAPGVRGPLVICAPSAPPGADRLHRGRASGHPGSRRARREPPESGVVSSLRPTLLEGHKRYSSRLSVLQAFSADRARMSASEVADVTGLSAATAHRILKTLQSQSYLEQDSQTREYSLGIGILKLASLIADRHDEVALLAGALSGLRPHRGDDQPAPPGRTPPGLYSRGGFPPAREGQLGRRKLLSTEWGRSEQGHHVDAARRGDRAHPRSGERKLRPEATRPENIPARDCPGPAARVRHKPG